MKSMIQILLKIIWFVFHLFAKIECLEIFYLFFQFYKLFN